MQLLKVLRDTRPANVKANRARARKGKEKIMKLSARNQLKGIITNVAEGAVNGVVTIDLGGIPVTADITMNSIDELGLAEGKEAFAVIKATNVMFAAGTERIANISARNQLPGTIAEVKKGAVNGHVALALADGNRITGSITNAAIDELGLAEGQPALAVIKATDVMVGIE